MSTIIEQLEEWTDDVAEKIHNKLTRKLHRAFNSQRVTTYVVSSQNNRSDSSGDVDFAIYANTTGKHLVIGRVVLWADGYDPSNPFLGGYLAIYSGRQFNAAAVFDMAPDSAGGQLLPNVASYGGHNALRLRQNEILSLHMVGGPTNTNVTGTIFGFLEPTDSDYDL